MYDGKRRVDISAKARWAKFELQIVELLQKLKMPGVFKEFPQPFYRISKYYYHIANYCNV